MNIFNIIPKKSCNFYCTLFFLLISSLFFHSLPARGNNDLPAFDVNISGRGFNWISVHPDGEQWLITECTDRIAPPRENCFLFLYNIKTKRYRRYDLPSSYFYSDAQFSTNGQMIVAIRRPIPNGDSHTELERVYGESEIFLMNTEGKNFRTIPLIKGRYKTPLISPDETKVTYWRARIARPEGSKTLISGYELHEFDLRLENDSLFSSATGFFLAGQFQYKNSNQIVADAYGPFFSEKTRFNYFKKFNFSQIYCFSQGIEKLGDPCITEVAWASKPSFDLSGNLYLYGQHQKYGVGFFEMSGQEINFFWKLPLLADQGISALMAAPSGNYLAFIYPTASARRFKNHRALGLFDIRSERWISVSPPQPETSETIPLL